MSQKCTPLWREAHFQVKMYKTPHVRATFGRLGCRKSARRCGAKHISKSKCTKHTRSGPLLEVEMSKKCTPLWREARFPSQNVQNTKCSMFAPLLEVRMLNKCTPLWREAHFEVKMYRALGVRTTFGGSDVASLRFGSFTLHYTLHYTTIHYTTLHSTTLQLQLQNYTTTLHYTPLH